MIRSSACLSANDLSIKCRVRKSPFVTNPKFGDTVEMTCTMRNWSAQETAESVEALPKTTSNTSTASKETVSVVTSDPRHVGPELVLTPIETLSPMADRRDSHPPRRRSSGRRNSASNEPPPSSRAPSRIPLEDIMLVESVEGAKCHKMKITTQICGFFEFDNLTHNGRDVLFAFLQANLDKERLIVVDYSPDDNSVPSAASTTSSCSMDVEKFTAQRMERSNARESLSEKVSRRTSRLAAALSDLAGSIVDTACCRPKTDGGELRDAPPSPVVALQQPTTNTSNRSIKVKKGNLEEEESIASSRITHKYAASTSKTRVPSGLSLEPDTGSAESNREQRKQFRDSLKSFNFPSGLSVEREDPAEDESV